MSIAIFASRMYFGPESQVGGSRDERPKLKRHANSVQTKGSCQFFIVLGITLSLASDILLETRVERVQAAVTSSAVGVVYTCTKTKPDLPAKTD